MNSMSIEPVKIAIIGAGARSSNQYAPLYADLKPWVEVVAVCDPVAKHAEALATRLGARAYTDIRELVKDKPMEAVIVITPVESHHSISVLCTQHGIHNLVETSWCSLLEQAREMTKLAEQNHVITRVAENFIHYPADYYSRLFIDPVRRFTGHGQNMAQRSWPTLLTLQMRSAARRKAFSMNKMPSCP